MSNKYKTTSRNARKQKVTRDPLEELMCNVNLNYLEETDTVWNRPKVHLPPDEGDVEKITYYTDRDVLFSLRINCDPENYIDYLVERCLLYPYLLIVLAQTLSTVAVAKICNAVFGKKHVISKEFLELFYGIFIPNFLKGYYSWFSLDIIKRASAAYPELFNLLIQKLVQHGAVPKIVLKDYVVNISAEKKNEVINIIASMSLTPHQFIKHLETIHLLFQDSDKTANVCEFVVKYLHGYACYCYTNKDFGRLLMTYLTNYSRFPIHLQAMRTMVENHFSEYKGVCETLYFELCYQILTLQQQLDEYAPIYIMKSFEEDRDSTRCL